MKSKEKIVIVLKWLMIVVCFFGALALLNESLNLQQYKPSTPSEKIINIFGILLAALFVLGVHELGHLTMGLYHGFRFELFVVGPLGIKRENDSIKVYFNTDFALFGGIASTSPSAQQVDVPKKFAQVLLAGPIISMLFALVCFVLVPIIGNPFASIAFTAGAISLGIFIVTTFPERTGVFYTDRKRYQRLITPGKEQDVELAILRIMGNFSKDNSYKDVNLEDIETLLSAELPFFKLYGYFNKICFELENFGNVEEATLQAYQFNSKGLPKNMLSAWSKEIKSFEDKFARQVN